MGEEMKTGGQTEWKKGKTEICCSLVWQHHCLWWKGWGKRGRGEGGVRMVFTDLFLILYLTHNLLLFLVCLSRLLFNFPYCVSCCQSFAPVCFLSLSVFHFPPFYLCTILWFVVLSFPTCGNSVFTGRQFLHLLLQPHFITAEQCPSTLQGLVVL